MRGDVKYVDLDGDNIISPTLSANDVKDQKVIGNSFYQDIHILSD